jgi:Putative helicase
VGTHLAPYLIGSLRALVESGKWKPNDSPLLVDKRGMYLRWPEAAEDLVAMAVSNGAQGVPGTPAILAEMLKDARLVETSPTNDLGLTEIVDPDGEIVHGYRVANPNAVLPDFDPSDYASERAQALDTVIAEDPILAAAAQKVEESPAQTGGSPNEPPVAEPEVAQVTLPFESQDGAVGEHEPEIAAAAPAVAVQTESADAPKTAANSQMTQVDTPEKLAEAQERKYSDLVPKQVKNDLRTPLIIEVTGKVIEAWNSRDESSSKVMRMTENGAAILYDHLKTLMRSPPDWVNKMAEAGLIYTQPSLPGVKVQKISIPEGGPAKQAVVISKLGCRTLGLK